VKTYMPGGTKAIADYDAALNCLTLAYRQNKNCHYILVLQQDRLVLFPENIVTKMTRSIALRKKRGFRPFQ